MHHTFTHERRNNQRSYVAAVATVFTSAGRLGEYAVRDLSAGGALLVDGPEIAVGTTCEILLRVSGLGNLRIAAETLDAAGRRGVAVRFSALRPEVADGLEELVQQEIARRDVPSVLVASTDLEQLAALADALAALGERALLATNALEAQQWLGDPDTSVALIVVCGELVTSTGQSFADYAKQTLRRACHVVSGVPDDDELRRLLDEYQGARSKSEPVCGAAPARRRETQSPPSR